MKTTTYEETRLYRVVGVVRFKNSQAQAFNTHIAAAHFAQAQNRIEASFGKGVTSVECTVIEVVGTIQVPA